MPGFIVCSSVFVVVLSVSPVFSVFGAACDSSSPALTVVSSLSCCVAPLVVDSCSLDDAGVTTKTESGFAENPSLTSGLNVAKSSFSVLASNGSSFSSSADFKVEEIPSPNVSFGGSVVLSSSGTDLTKAA